MLKNGYQSLSTDEEDLKLQKWRIEYEKKHNLEKEFFRVACIEDDKMKSNEIIKIMKSEYGMKTEKWLKNHFIKN